MRTFQLKLILLFGVVRNNEPIVNCYYLVFGLFDLLIQSAKFLVQRIQIFFVGAQRNLILDSHPAQFQYLD